ncbi:MAG: MFS transporter [Firmicutes bacterium]|nr:MFS transporter [Bacillota bacterium]
MSGVPRADRADAVPTGAASIWRNPNLVILVAGQWVSQVGNTLFGMAMYWFILQRTGSRADLGFAGAVVSFAGLAGLAAGAFVDRWDRRRTMVWTDAVRAVLSLVLVGVALAHRLDVAAVVGVAFSMALLATLFSPAQAALVPAVVPAERLPEANALNQGASAAAQLAGSALGGVVLGALGPVILFGFNGLSFVASVVSLLLLRLPEAAHAGARAAGGGVRALWREVVAGQRAIWQSPFLRRTTSLSLVVNFAMAPLNYLDVAWVRQVLHMGAVVYGLLGIAILAGMIGGSVAAARVQRLFAFRAIALGTLGGAGMSIVAFALVPAVLPDLGFLIVFGALVGIANTAATTVLQAATPDHLRGRVFGTLVALATLATPLGALLTGLAAAALPLPVVFASAGILTALASLLGVGLPDEVRLAVEETA